MEAARTAVSVASGYDLERAMAQLIFSEWRTGREAEAIATFQKYQVYLDTSGDASREAFYFLGHLLDKNYDKEALELMQRIIDAQRTVAFYWKVAQDSNPIQLLQFAVRNKAEDLLCQLYERGEYILAADDLEENDASGEIEGALPAIRLVRGLVLLKVTDQDEYALDLLHKGIMDQEIVDTDFSATHHAAKEALLKAYLCKILSAKSSGDEEQAQLFSSRLSAFVQENSITPTGDNISLTVAVWHRVENRVADAQVFLRPCISLAIDMLTDGTEDNDADAWFRLSDALSVSGDRDNALAAEWKRKQLQLELKDDSENAQLVWCDGCGNIITFCNALFRCCYCVETDICESCHELLLKTKMPFRVCGKSHEFMHVPGVDTAHAKDEIKVNGEFLKITDWLDKLKEKYLGL
jgi:hypothetical protein